MKLRTLACFLPIALAGCGSEPGARDESASDKAPISWEEFKQSAMHVVDGRTIYVVEWDLSVSEEGLRQYYDEHIAPSAKSRGDLGEITQRAAVDTTPGRDNIFHGQQMNLRYCVSNDLGSYKSRAVSDMSVATANWEWVSRVHFVYASSEDANCSNANPSIMIALRPISGGPDACGAFPTALDPEHDYCPARTLRIDYAQVDLHQTTLTPNVDAAGVLKHELGHMLGLRHEHARPEACAGFESSTNMRGLTPYDTTSVMHYPGLCGVPNTKDFSISPYDMTGMRRLYGENSNKLIWHNSAGQSELWNMRSDGLSRINYVDFPGSLNTADSTGWTPIGMADFNKDGWTDIIWHHTSGATSFWYMNGSVDLIGSGYMDGWWGVPDSGGTRMVGFADFNKDGNPDILLHNSSGANTVWYMDGATPVGLAIFSTWLNFADSSGWRIEAVTDFNHDGNPDWFMHNGITGQMQIWYFDGINLSGLGSVDSSLNIPDSSGWSLLGAYDFNRDGSPDLIWHHPSGAAGYWYMDGTTVLGISTFSDPNLQIPDSWGWKIIRR